MADEKKETKVVFERPHALLPVVTNYCPGCAHRHCHQVGG